MKIILKIFLLTCTLFSQNLLASNVVATVNGAIITQEEVNNFVISSIPGANFSLLTKEQKEAVIKKMIDRKLFLEDAKKIKIEKNKDFKLALEKMKENLMLDYWMKKKVEEIYISPRTSRTYYEEHYIEFNKPASVRVRHILLGTEEEALRVIDALQPFILDTQNLTLEEKFIALAKEKSTGPSAINGGLLDWFTPEEMVPEFSEVAFSLKKGTISEQVVKTQFGYHVIYLKDKKESGVIPFELVKDEIVKQLRLSKFKIKLGNLSKDLKKTAKIIVK